MPIPKFDETFMSILKVLFDGAIVGNSGLASKLLQSRKFFLSPEEEKQETASGANLFASRVGWGQVYLKQGKLVEVPERGMVRITEKGLAILRGGKALTLVELKRDPDFLTHQKKVSIQRDSE